MSCPTTCPTTNSPLDDDDDDAASVPLQTVPTAAAIARSTAGARSMCPLNKCTEPICDVHALRALHPSNDFPVRCNGRPCPIYPRFLNRCISKLIDPRSLNVNMLFLNYPFGTKPNPMTNEAMRAVLYYFYATKVYLLFGRWQRVELPFCLVSRIRELFPSNKGDKYTGHKDVTIADLLGL
jgi:hypothetical protein